MVVQKKVVLIKTGRLEDSIRLPKEIMALKKEGYTITLLCWDAQCKCSKPEKSEEYDEMQLRLKAPSGIKRLLLFPIWWSFVFVYLMLLKWDIVHAVDIDSIPPAIIAGKLKRKPIIYEMIDICEYELILPEWIRKIIVKIDKLFMMSVNGVIVVDEMQIVGLGGVPNSRVVTIYDSPPINLLPNNGPAYQNDGKFTLFYVGMFFKSKRLHLDKVVEAIKDLENVNLVIAGYGDLVEEIREWAHQMPGKVEFIGRISYSDVFKIGAMADLMFVLRDPIILANKYTCGSTFLSAMMLGKPVLATEGTSTADKVHKDNSGLVINSNNAEEIRVAIITLRDNPELCKELGSNAGKAYDQRYSWDIMERRLLDIYRELTGEVGDR